MDIGIDFGTTNSVLAYTSDGKLEMYTLGGAGGTPYIPSVLLANDNDPANDLIGRAAKSASRAGNRFLQHFKLLLGRGNSGDGANEADEAARRFLGNIITRFKQDMRLEDIDSLVITAPEAWVRDGRNDAHEALINICKELKLPLKKILSEPIAAASYFATKYKAKHEKDYKGHVLVYDHGGGTLDVCLASIDGTEIGSVEGSGLAAEVYEDGFGGVAYDKKVMKAAKSTSPEWAEAIDRDEGAWLEDFEQSKRALSAQIADAIAEYHYDKQEDNVIFEVQNFPITPSLLCDVFDQYFKADIVELLSAFQVKISEVQEDHPGAEFKVLMVGGFSGFAPVRNLVKETLGWTGEMDPRFNENTFTLDDTAYAIAKGAALYAANDISIYETCPVTVGVCAYEDGKKEVFIPLLKRAEKTDDLAEVKYCEHEIGLANSRATAASQRVQFYTEDLRGKHPFSHNITLAEALPDFHAGRANWHVGAYVDNKMVIRIVFKKTGSRANKKEITLGDLIGARNRKEQHYGT